MNRFFLTLAASVFLLSCGQAPGDQSTGQARPLNETDTVDRLVHPDWSKNAVMYELNVRQHSPKGDLSSAKADLARIKQLGIDVIWLMPIHPIGEVNRKGGENDNNRTVEPGSSSLGSPYSVRDYTALNPDFGTKADLDEFVSAAHDYGMKVILDWVANHTSFDATWAQDSLGSTYYLRDAAGALQPPLDTDWTDVAQLDWDNGETSGLYDAMEEAMVYWVQEHNVDGYRCDVAGKVPTAFWDRARRALERVKPDVFMLAEAEEPGHHERAFDASYAWEFHHLTNEVAKGEKSADDVRAYLAAEATRFPSSAYRLTFTSNHDENSWNGTTTERYGQAMRGMAVLCGTAFGMPLIYGGQESEMNKRLRFFEKDTVPWGDYRALSFYRILNDLHHRNSALFSGEEGAAAVQLVTEGDVLYFERENAEGSVRVLINMSENEVEFTPEGLDGYRATFSRKSLDRKKWSPWSFEVFVKTGA